MQTYKAMLEEATIRSNRAVILGTILYSLSQSMFLFVIALVFRFGSILVARGEATLFQFFVVLVVCAHVPSLGVTNLFNRVPQCLLSKQGRP